MSKDKWARLVKEAIKKYFENELRNKMMNGYSKLKNSKLIEEHLGMKDYVNKMTLSDARTNFRIRSSMVSNVKLNQRSNPEYERTLWLCDECGKVDSQSHIMWCPSYATLREGLDIENDLDVVHYFQSVVKIREALKNED